MDKFDALLLHTKSPNDDLPNSTEDSSTSGLDLDAIRKDLFDFDRATKGKNNNKDNNDKDGAKGAFELNFNRDFSVEK